MKGKPDLDALFPGFPVGQCIFQEIPGNKKRISVGPINFDRAEQE